MNMIMRVEYRKSTGELPLPYQMDLDSFQLSQVSFSTANGGYAPERPGAHSEAPKGHV